MLRARSLLALPVFALGLAAAPAHALVDQWGVEVNTSTANCPSFCTNFEDSNSDGGENFLTASTSSNSSKGSGAAEGTLGFTPVLKGQTASNETTQGSGRSQSFAVEGYTYNGVGSKTFDLNIVLDGTIVDSTPLDDDTRITAEVVFYESDVFAFISDRGTLDFEFGATPIDSTTLLLDTTTGTQALGSISVTVDPGDDFYLWVRLNTQAHRDLSTADAFSTLTMSFADGGGLTNASGGITVPEPSLLGLLGLAGIAFAGRRRH